MRARTFLASLYLLNFIIGISATIYVLDSSWNNLGTWHTAFYIYYLVLGFCGVAVALWIVIDGKHIERCVVKIKDLERRIQDFETQIDRIKTLRLKGTST